MKDFYGKTSINTRFKALPGSYLSDLGNLHMAFSSRPFVLPAILLILCCYLTFFFRTLIPVILLCLAVISGAFILWQQKKGGISVILTALITCLILVYISVYIDMHLNAVTPADQSRFECVVTSVDRDLSGDVSLIVRLDGGALASVRYYGEDDSFSSVCTGDSLILYGKLKEPSTARNPGGFDYRDYLLKKGILYTINCERFEVAEIAGFPLDLTGFLQSGFFSLRKNVIDAVSRTFPEEYRALTAALCSGDRSLISDDIQRDFKLSCCSHLLAVSGTHFAGFLACVPFILEALNIKRKKAFAVHVFFCILIGCFTGWNSSVTRASIMSICVFADRDWLSALSLASAVMTIADPFCPLSAGFQMSFCSVIGIKIYSAKISSCLIRFRIGEKLASLISPALSASLGMIPFWSDISMRPDLFHLLIQISASFIAGMVCTCFVPCALMSLVFPFWSEYLSMPLLLCLKALMKVVTIGSLVSEKSGAPVHFNKAFLIILSLAAFLFVLPPCFMRKTMLKIVSLILAAAIGLEVFSVINRPSCKVVFADVGQGDCCLIITPDKTCLIDAGTYSEGASTVRDILDYYGIPKVDVCIMSHWDTDHAGGIAALFNQGRTGTILTSYVPKPDDINKDVSDFFKAVTPEGLDRTSYLSSLRLFLAGDRIELSSSVYIEALYPSESTGAGNEESLVLMLHIADSDTSILYTGDIGTSTEQLLLDRHVDVDCDILKVAHHGSKYSSSSDFIASASPSIAVISVGANNFYGHPSPDAISRLRQGGCSIFRTDQEGAVVLEY